MKKAKEMEELLLEDDQMTNNIKTSIKKGKKDKNDDFSLLNQALASAPKTKKQKEEEEREERTEETIRGGTRGRGKHEKEIANAEAETFT